MLIDDKDPDQHKGHAQGTEHQVFETCQDRMAFLRIGDQDIHGETQNFQCSDFVRNLESFMGRPVDAVIYNDAKPDRALCDLYAIQKSEFVQIDPQASCWRQRKLYAHDLLETSSQIIRHDSKKLAALLDSLFQKEFV